MSHSGRHRTHARGRCAGGGVGRSGSGAGGAGPATGWTVVRALRLARVRDLMVEPLDHLTSKC
eukprot:4910490-Prymnesium_polylepis.1